MAAAQWVARKVFHPRAGLSSKSFLVNPFRDLSTRVLRRPPQSLGDTKQFKQCSFSWCLESRPLARFISSSHRSSEDESVETLPHLDLSSNSTQIGTAKFSPSSSLESKQSIEHKSSLEDSYQQQTPPIIPSNESVDPNQIEEIPPENVIKILDENMLPYLKELAAQAATLSPEDFGDAAVKLLETLVLDIRWPDLVLSNGLPALLLKLEESIGFLRPKTVFSLVSSLSCLSAPMAHLRANPDRLDDSLPALVKDTLSRTMTSLLARDLLIEFTPNEIARLLLFYKRADVVSPGLLISALKVLEPSFSKLELRDYEAIIDVLIHQNHQLGSYTPAFISYLREVIAHAKGSGFVPVRRCMVKLAVLLGTHLAELPVDQPLDPHVASLFISLATEFALVTNTYVAGTNTAIGSVLCGYLWLCGQAARVPELDATVARPSLIPLFAFIDTHKEDYAPWMHVVSWAAQRLKIAQYALGNTGGVTERALFTRPPPSHPQALLDTLLVDPHKKPCASETPRASSPLELKRLSKFYQSSQRMFYEKPLSLDSPLGQQRARERAVLEKKVLETEEFRARFPLLSTGSRKSAEERDYDRERHARAAWDTQARALQAQYRLIALLVAAAERRSKLEHPRKTKRSSKESPPAVSPTDDSPLGLALIQGCNVLRDPALRHDDDVMRFHKMLSALAQDQEFIDTIDTIIKTPRPTNVLPEYQFAEELERAAALGVALPLRSDTDFRAFFKLDKVDLRSQALLRKVDVAHETSRAGLVKCLETHFLAEAAKARFAQNGRPSKKKKYPSKLSVQRKPIHPKEKLEKKLDEPFPHEDVPSS